MDGKDQLEPLVSEGVQLRARAFKADQQVPGCPLLTCRSSRLSTSLTAHLPHTSPARNRQMVLGLQLAPQPLGAGLHFGTAG